MLWSPTSPSIYTLTASVRVGSTTVDDDVVPFGIRTIKYDADAGFSLNGTSLKFKGAGMHHDVSGLGAAVPMRAWQRRLAQMKQIGINAIRTSHNPYSPEFLDLARPHGLPGDGRILRRVDGPQGGGRLRRHDVQQLRARPT